MWSVHRQSEILLELARATISRERAPDAKDLAEIMPCAKENGMGFYLLSLLASGAHSENVGKIATAEHVRLAERQVYVEREAVRLHRFFVERDLPVFFIKDFMRYPFTDHDIDFVAVRRSLAATYRASMKEIGYQYRFGKSQLREPDKYFYYPVSAEEAFADIRFHLHKALSWNGVVFLDSEAVLARCREASVAAGIFLVPACEDEILIMAAHALFENASIKIGEILEFGLLVRDEKIDWEYVIDVATRRHWQAALAYFLEAVWTVLSGTQGVTPARHVRDWAAKTLAEAGVGDVRLPCSILFPHEIPYAVCMRLYMDKMRRDIRAGGLGGKELLAEGLSFFVSIWFSRLKRRLR